MTPDIEELLAKAEAKRKQLLFMIDKIVATEEMMDEDGYPTPHLLWVVEHWPYQDDGKFMEFLKQFWYHAWWGWKSSEEDHPYRQGRKVIKYRISTAGWSGNESLIAAFERNSTLWWKLWEQSRRGGHYIFELDLHRNDEPESSQITKVTKVEETKDGD